MVPAGAALLATPFLFGASTTQTVTSLVCAALLAALGLRRGPVRGRYGNWQKLIVEESAMPKEKWSQKVTEHSDALDLDRGVFANDDPAEIARSLKRSAERSKRRKSAPFHSAMSMLTFYINRAGDTLPARRRRILERAKDELRKAFGRSGKD